MNYHKDYQKIIANRPLLKGDSFDLIVVGGGVAGVGAALAAARNGLKVLLLEKNVTLGGLATNGLISWYEPLCDGKGHQIIKGLAEELLRLSIVDGYNNLPTIWGGSFSRIDNNRYSTCFSPTAFALNLLKVCLDNHIDVRFNYLATYPLMDQNICCGVLVENMDGLTLFECKYVIDATGDATILARAGVPTIVGHNWFTYISHTTNINAIKNINDYKDYVHLRNWTNVGLDMDGSGHPLSEKIVYNTSNDVNEYLIMAQLDTLDVIKKEKIEITSLPNMPQLRTIRRLVGNSDFKAVDGMKYLDSIGNIGDFRMDKLGNHYQIPLGALWNREFPNILAAGRIISAEEGDGWETSRVIPVCVLTGEAAGKAVSLCIKNNKELSSLTKEDIEWIRVC